jgi:hypothetical protein
MPKIECSADAVAARAAILNDVANGGLTPGEAMEIFNLIDMFTKTLRRAKTEGETAALLAGIGL